MNNNNSSQYKQNTMDEKRNTTIQNNALHALRHRAMSQVEAPQIQNDRNIGQQKKESKLYHASARALPLNNPPTKVVDQAYVNLHQQNESQNSNINPQSRSYMWEMEARRLSKRIRALEAENNRLKSRNSSNGPPKSYANGYKLLKDATKETKNGIAPRSLPKSQSFANSMNSFGLTISEATAASHLSRSKRNLSVIPPIPKSMHLPTSTADGISIREYQSGYWNNSGSIKSSFSCGNLAGMDRRRSSYPLAAQAKEDVEADEVATLDSEKLNMLGLQVLQIQRTHSLALTELDAQTTESPIASVPKVTSPQSIPSVTIVNDVDDSIDNSLSPGAINFPICNSFPPRGASMSSIPFLTGAPKSTTGSSSIHLWVGTWNMGASDPFAIKGQALNAQAASKILKPFLPQGYQLYVVGIQEGVSEHVYQAILMHLNLNSSKHYERLELQNSMFHLKNKSQSNDATIDAVHGRGDGAFMGRKFTGIAVFYASEVKESGNLDLLRAGVYKFKVTSGSKGGVAVALRLCQRTTIVFVNCHLDARNDTYRREQIRSLNTNLGRIMGHFAFELTEQFHHVVWMGDLNYRIVNISPSDVLDMLEKGQTRELHDKYDGLLNDRTQASVFDGFREPRKARNFYPTYKKFPKRADVTDQMGKGWSALVYRTRYKEPFYKGGKVKTRVPGWCDRILTHSLGACGSILEPEKVMEGNEWVDNYRSVNDGEGMDISDHSPVFATFILRISTINDAAKMLAMLDVRASRSSRLERQYTDGSWYNTTESSLVASSEDPYRSCVGGSYFDQKRVIHRIASKKLHSRPISTVLRIFNMQLHWNTDHFVTPKRTRVVAPLIAEDMGTDAVQCDVLGGRVLGNRGWNLSTNAVMQHTSPLQDMHMLIWIKHDHLVGHCTVSLKRIAEQLDAGADLPVKFRVKLYSNSCPLYQDGHPLLLVFTVRGKMFAK